MLDVQYLGENGPASPQRLFGIQATLVDIAFGNKHQCQSNRSLDTVDMRLNDLAQPE